LCQPRFETLLRFSGFHDKDSTLTIIIAILILDAENHLSSTAGISYAYDGDGKRVAKFAYVSVCEVQSGASQPQTATPAAITCLPPKKRVTVAEPQNVYFYGQSSAPLEEVIETCNSSGQCTPSSSTEYVFFAGQRVAKLLGSSIDYYFSDHLGTTRVVTDSSGNILDDSDFYPFGGERPIVGPSSGNTYKFTGKERDSESGLDNFGARHYASSMGRFMTPDPAGIAFSVLSAPQSWNLYSYVQNNPLKFTDPDGRECVWDDGSFDSKDDASTGSYAQCSAAGGHYFDPSTFTSGGGQDWSSQANQGLADFIQRGEEAGPAPDISQASSLDTSTTGQTTTINFSGINWFGSQWRFGNHPFRDNNPGDILSGGFTDNHGSIGNDGRFAVFPTSGTGQQALDSLLHGPGYINVSIDDAVARYAPAMENNTAGYQQFLQNVVGVSGNASLSSLTPQQFSALENGIARYEGFYAPGGYSVTATSVIGVPHQ
jgi:RHS repeat-associated protein